MENGREEGYKMEEKVENGKMKNGGERGEKRRDE